MSLKEDAKNIEGTLIEMRRTVHKNPELGFEEFETNKYIISQLERLGIPHKSGCGSKKSY